MKVATVILKTNQLGSTVRLINVTPIEALYLVAEHHVSAGGEPFDLSKIVEESFPIPCYNETNEPVLDEEGKQKMVEPPWATSKWTKNQEMRRLRAKYPIKKIDAMMQKVVELPETYADALAMGLDTELPSQRLVESVAG